MKRAVNGPAAVSALRPGSGRAVAGAAVRCSAAWEERPRGPVVKREVVQAGDEGGAGCTVRLRGAGLRGEAGGRLFVGFFADVLRFIVDERQLDVKRIGESHHDRQRQLLRFGQKTRRDLVGACTELVVELLPVEVLVPSLVVQVRRELGGSAGARRRDAAVKRREQAHHASEAWARRGAGEHPPEIAGLHASGACQVGEGHASLGHPCPDRRQQLQLRHWLTVLRQRARRYAHCPLQGRDARGTAHCDMKRVVG
jgi:hypothetical protein